MSQTPIAQKTKSSLPGINLRTELIVEFEPIMPLPPQYQAQLDADNKVLHEIAEGLQPVFRQLVIAMLEQRKTN